MQLFITVFNKYGYTGGSASRNRVFVRGNPTRKRRLQERRCCFHVRWSRSRTRRVHGPLPLPSLSPSSLSYLHTHARFIYYYIFSHSYTHINPSQVIMRDFTQWFIYFTLSLCVIFVLYDVSGNLLWHAGEIQIWSDAAFWRSHHLPQQDRNSAYRSLQWFFSSNTFRLVVVVVVSFCFTLLPLIFFWLLYFLFLVLYSLFVDICARCVITLSLISHVFCALALIWVETELQEVN